MKSGKLTLVVQLVLLLVFLVSCSNSFPTTPDLNKDKTGNFLPSVGVSEWSADGKPVAGYGFLGLYYINVDPLSLKAYITPIRNSSSADVLEVVDITNFLMMAPCTDCAKIKSVSLNLDSNLVLTIGIKHPFPVGDPLKPITGKNRADLHVFNVEGIIVSDGIGVKKFSGIGPSCAEVGLINADGYTGYLDKSLDSVLNTKSDIHPYKLHFDDFSNGNYNPMNPMGFESVTSPPPYGHLVMPMGCDYDYKDYIFDLARLTSAGFDFIFAIGCTYAVSADSKNQRFTPVYRLPQHNKKAATMVNVNIVSNQLSAGDTSSSAQLEIRVVDVNHGIPVGSALNEMRADSSVSSIKIEIPGVTTSVVNVPLTPTSGDGLTPATALVYPVTITNSAAATEGVYLGLVKVTDAYPTGLNVSPLLSGRDAISRVDPYSNPLTGLFSLSEFATYAYFHIPVELHNEPPLAILKPLSTQVVRNGTVTWNASDSYDPDGSIVLYEFDFILDGGNPQNFTPDVSTTNPIQVSSPYGTLGNFIAAVRVTDNRGAKDIATSNVEVVEQRPDLTLNAVRASWNSQWTGGITRVHLDWEDMPGAVEYAVYRSHLYANPYSWSLLGTTTPPVSEFDDVYLQTINYLEWIDHKYIYEVRPRTIAGDPASEGLPSQRALIFMESNDFDPANLSQKAPPDPEQPNFLWKYGAGGDFGPQYSGMWRLDEEPMPPSWWVNITVWNEPQSSWEVFYTGLPIPDIEGQTMAYFDFAFSNGPYSPSDPNIGFAPGTFSAPPPTDGLPTFFDFDPAPASDYMLGAQYKSTFNSLAFENFFGEPAGTKAFHNQYYPFFITRYKITRLLEPDVDYAAIGLASWQYTSGVVAYHMWESIAIVVY